MPTNQLPIASLIAQVPSYPFTVRGFYLRAAFKVRGEFLLDRLNGKLGYWNCTTAEQHWCRRRNEERF